MYDAIGERGHAYDHKKKKYIVNNNNINIVF